MLYICETLGDRPQLPEEEVAIALHVSRIEKGDRLSLGASRLWHVVGVDYFTDQAETVGVVYLDLDPDRERSDWLSARLCAERPCHCLTAYLADGEMVHWKHSMRDNQPEIGSFLPKFNIAEHTISSQPWGVNSFRKLLPVADLEHPCHRHVYLAECVYSPESVLVTEPELVAA